MKLLSLMPALVALLIAGCNQPSEKPKVTKIPDDLVELRSNAFACWRDSEFAPVEHSEHCVLVAEQFFEKVRDECIESSSADCNEYNLALSNIRELYVQAITNSFIKFGVRPWIEQRAKNNSLPGFIFDDGEEMRRQFENCLRLEQEELAEDGLQPITTIIDRPLQPGQQCFRFGYPEFVTAPLRDT